MVPQNAPKITKEMIRQLEIEQIQFQRELERHYGWVNQNRILLRGILHGINIKWKSHKKDQILTKLLVRFLINMGLK